MDFWTFTLVIWGVTVVWLLLKIAGLIALIVEELGSCLSGED